MKIKMLLMRYYSGIKNSKSLGITGIQGSYYLIILII